jgi:nicotinamidase-related amidase
MSSTRHGVEIEAEPYEFECSVANTALLIVDMQRDFVSQGGFGEFLGNDVSAVRDAIQPTQCVLKTAREVGLPVIYTREGHESHLADCPPSKQERGRLDVGIGDEGPMGDVLVRGEDGHEIVPELEPEPEDVVIDKPGKGSFYATDLNLILQNQDIDNLIVTGVTTEVCVHTTIREANDRGYDCLMLEDCVGSYFEEFQRVGVKMIKAQGGIFGWVTDSESLTDALVSARN